MTPNLTPESRDKILEAAAVAAATALMAAIVPMLVSGLTKAFESLTKKRKEEE